VVIPAFNTAQSVTVAIASALAQRDIDLEVVVVDDGSTDQTASRVREIQDRDARVRLFQQAHGGVARARNRGMSEARGEFIAFLDSDDEWMPEYLEAQLLVLEDPKYAVVTANVLNRGGRDDGRPYWPASNALHELTLLDLITRVDAVCIMAVLRREVYEAVGLFDDTFEKASEDYDYWLRAAAAGFRFVQQRRPLGWYRRGGPTLSADSLAMVTGTIRALEKLQQQPWLTSDVERAAVDRQLERFSHERLGIEAAAALRSRNFRIAATNFGSLYAAKGGVRLAVIALWSRLAPTLLLRLDSIRRSFRQSIRGA
jgi:hypothetical protein